MERRSDTACPAHLPRTWNATDGSQEPGRPSSGRAETLVVVDVHVLHGPRWSLFEEEGHRETTETFGQRSATAHRARIVSELPDVIVLDGWQFLHVANLAPGTVGIPVVIRSAGRQTVLEMSGQLAALDVEVVLEPFDITA